MEQNFKNITAPFDRRQLSALRRGDFVLISGKLFTARDAGHKRIVEMLAEGERLPIDLRGQGIFYVGACFRDGQVVACGPTTSARMDDYAPVLYRAGVLATLGKGDRNVAVKESIKEVGGVYFSLIGGAGAKYAQCVKSAKLIAFDDLGTEALYEFDVENMPAIVAIDAFGESIYER